MATDDFNKSGVLLHSGAGDTYVQIERCAVQPETFKLYQALKMRNLVPISSGYLFYAQGLGETVMNNTDARG